MNMIEKVARGIISRWYYKDFNELDGVTQAEWLKIAKAAIEAMREPTEEMIKAADNSKSLEEGSSAYGCWYAMIDESLKED